VAFLKVKVANSDETLSFGNWGYCILKSGGDTCSGRSIGYQLGRIVEQLDGVTMSSSTATATHNLSRALILHPIACGVAFLSFLTALASHRIGFLFSSLIAFVALVITMIAMIIDWVNFETIHHHVNGSDGPGHGASFGSAIWMVVAAFILLLLGSITVICGCFTDRRRRGRTTGARY
jgi:uncharacterized membrane protein